MRSVPIGTVGPDVAVTDRCVIGAGCDVTCKETLSQDTIIYGADCRRYHKKVPLQVRKGAQLVNLLKRALFLFADDGSATIGISD